MSESGETQAMAQVIDRLSQRFPSLERDQIANVVQEEYGHLEEGRVRDFVPVLVEKAAKNRLKKVAEESRTVVERPEALSPLPDSAPDPDPMEVERASREGHPGPVLGDLLGSSGENES